LFKKAKTFFNSLPVFLIIYFIGIRSFFLISQLSLQVSDLNILGYFSEKGESSSEVKNSKEKKQSKQKVLIKNPLYFYEDFLISEFFQFVVLAFSFVSFAVFREKIKLSYLPSHYRSRAPPHIC